MKFINLPKESPDDRENREQQELRIAGPLEPIYAIPYEYIGHNSASRFQDGLDPKQYTKNYPDWYKLTPAYDIKYSGMEPLEQFTTLFNPSSSNSIKHRIGRWLAEDKTVIYCDRWDKLTAVASTFLLIMTVIVTLYQLHANAKVKYTASNPNNAASVARAARLDSFAASPYWTFAKLVCSSIPAAVIAWNAFKRTTLPKRNTQIGSFKNRTVIPNTSDIPKDRKPTIANMRNAKIIPADESERSESDRSRNSQSTQVTPWIVG
jgi:hypothetical protein